MRTIPREGLSRAAIDRSFMRQQESSGGIDYTAHLQIPNDLTSLRNYFSQMSMVDDGVGRVLAALEQQGLAENTLVIYSADHGFSLGHNGFWGHGQATWPANAHRAAYSIPLLVRHTGRVQSGLVENRMISQVDLFATIRDYLGMPETESNANSASRSFASLLRGESLDWDADEVFIEQEEVRAVRTQEWLYVQRFKGSPEHPFGNELYDLVRDPSEHHNLIADAEYQNIAREFRDRVEAYFNEHAVPRYDLWRGGTTKSNSHKPAFWKSVWCADRAPVFD
ncbi:MAG: sulfatase [Anaerolineales bacterium]